MRYLFKDRGGAIAYFGCATESYANDNEKLAGNIYEYLRSNPGDNIGSIFANAKTACRDGNSLSYFLLGDPALRVSPGNTPVTVKQFPDSAPTMLKISVPTGLSAMHYSVSFTYRDTVSYPAPGSINGSFGFSFDSVLTTNSGVFQQTVDVPIPGSAAPQQKAIVYVWNDSADGRTQISFTAGVPNAVLSSHQNKAIAQTSLSIRQGNLIISNVKFNAGQIRIFDILGRVVYAGDFQQHSGTVSINLIGKNMAQGRYLLQLRSGANEITMPFMHIAR
jgi:hypothetical protein